jgi:hypothetical protein
MKKTLIFTVLILLSTFASAQRYGTAVGLRFGNNDFGRMIGVTAQQKIGDQLSLEAILQSDFDLNTNFSLLVEKHRRIISKRFNYYYGAGPSFGKEESFVKDPESSQILHTYGNSTVGMDLIAGVELTILNTAISLDYKPNINFSGREEFYRGQVGISARLVLVKSKDQKKRKIQRLRDRQKAQRKSRKTPFTQKIESVFQKKN